METSYFCNVYIPLVKILLRLLNKSEKLQPVPSSSAPVCHCSISASCCALVGGWVSPHVLKPAAYSLETPHPSPSLLPARQHQPVTHAHSHSRSHTGDLSPHSLFSVCVCVCPKCPLLLHTWNNAVIPLAACGLCSASGSCWSGWSGLEMVPPPPPTPTPPSFHRTAAWTAYSR